LKIATLNIRKQLVGVVKTVFKPVFFVRIPAITVVVLAVSLLFSSCQPKPGKGGILAINDMKLVMWDMVVADEFNSTYLTRDTLYKEKKDSASLVRAEINKSYQEVFALHKIEQKTYFESYDFYRKNPKYYKILLDSLSAYGSRERESRFMKTKSLPQPVKLPKDSLIQVPKDTLIP
jgi:hypothetical protein